MRVATADLRAGMVLAAPVSGPGGRQLAAAGTALTDKHLQVLRVWGIDGVEITDTAPTPSPAEEALRAAQRESAYRFRGQPVDHPAVRVLFQIAVKRLLRARN
jgi:hypothetical protein